MIGLTGAGSGPVCSDASMEACGCAGMEPGEVCCGSEEDILPAEVPMVPETRTTQQQLLQAILFVRPILLRLPAGALDDFPSDETRPALSSSGPSVQALLCVRTV